jgi:Matrixin/Fibronectin type III domain/Bacterial pre-peptidase C-terminal domain
VFPFLRRRPRPAGNPRASRRAHRAQLTLPSLESRITPYVLSGFQWASPEITVSYMPDGTTVDGYASALFANLNAVAPTATWQREFARALQTWAQYAPLNFHFVSDDGSAGGAIGAVQGNPRYGDIRLGTRVLGSNVLGYAHFPNMGTWGSTEGGDIALNSTRVYAIGADPDLYSTLLHESGHALGLDHSVAGTVMYGASQGVETGLTPDDIAGIQAMYGARRADSFDAAAANDNLGAATALTLTFGGVNVRADVTSQADLDYYRVVASGSSLTVSVDARNLSLLAPKVSIYDAAGNLLATASADYGQVATVTRAGLTPGDVYYVVADGATGDAFGVGAYGLAAQFSDAPAPPAPTPPAAPTALAAAAASADRVDLTWTDQSNDEDGFRVERSTDGTTFTFVANVGANATGYAVTGLSASTTYYFRVRAYNAVGDSAWSDTAQATTPAVPPPSLSPDRFEVNNTFATAKGLGRLTSTSQSGLTVHTASDVDYLAFTAKSGGTFNVSIRFTNASGNLDLYVYDARQRLLASGTSIADNESVSLSCLSGKKYYVRVFSPDGGMNSYDLVIARAGAGGALADAPRSGPASPVSVGEPAGERFPGWGLVLTPASAGIPPESAQPARTEGTARSHDRAARAAWAAGRVDWHPASVEPVTEAVRPGPSSGWILGDSSADPI